MKPGQPRHKWWALLCMIGIFALLLVGCRGEQQGPLVGNRVESLRINNDDGTAEQLHFPLDKPVFIEFWASWCPNCIANIPKLNGLYREYGTQLKFFGLSLDRNEQTMRGAMERHQILYPCTKAKPRLVNTFQVSGIPVTLLINRQGIVVYHHSGAIKPEILRKKIEQCLREDSSGKGTAKSTRG